VNRKTVNFCFEGTMDTNFSLWAEFFYHVCPLIAAIVSLNIWFITACGVKDRQTRRINQSRTQLSRTQVSNRALSPPDDVKPATIEHCLKGASEPYDAPSYHAGKETSGARPLHSLNRRSVSKNADEMKSRRSANDEKTSPRSKHGGKSVKARTRTKTLEVNEKSKHSDGSQDVEEALQRRRDLKKRLHGKLSEKTRTAEKRQLVANERSKSRENVRKSKKKTTSDVSSRSEAASLLVQQKERLSKTPNEAAKSGAKSTRSKKDRSSFEKSTKNRRTVDDKVSSKDRIMFTPKDSASPKSKKSLSKMSQLSLTPKNR